MKFPVLIIVVFANIGFFSCHPHDNAGLKTEILNTERNFEKMVADSGLASAFAYFAADSGVIQRGEKIIKGKEAIRSYYENQTMSEVKLEWKPDFIAVSRDGDLGYTYGPFRFWAINSKGDTVRREGIFHTVWKRQPDGAWRFVWD